jgi:hypothetical protein
MLGAIGPDVSFRLFGTSWTGGLFMSVLDVGQLLSTPLSSGSSTSSKPVAGGSFSLSQVLSPGIYGRVGLGSTPFVLGGGVAYAPGLRKYESPDAASSQQLSVLRVQGFLAVDLTLFPIATGG